MSPHNQKFSKFQGQPTPGYVYLVQAVGTNKHKIGKAVNVQNRIRALQTSSPLKIRYVYHAYVPNVYLCERELHKKFSNSREIGEWFALTLEDVKSCIFLMRLVQEVEPFYLTQEDPEFLTEETEEVYDINTQHNNEASPYTVLDERRTPGMAPLDVRCLNALSKLLPLLPSETLNEVTELIPLNPDKAIWLGLKILKMGVIPTSRKIFNGGTGDPNLQKVKRWYQELETEFGKIIE